MERLTKFDYENYRALKPKQDVVDKLGELEDVLEKWHIENLDKFLEEQISDLQHRLEVAERATNEMANYAINDNDLYDLVSDFNIENERYDEDHFGIDTCDVVDYFKEQAEKEETHKHIMSGEYIPVNIAEKSLKLSEQSQKQLAVEELEKLKDFFLEPYRDEEMDTDFLITKDAGSIADYVLDRIKELKGEE